MPDFSESEVDAAIPVPFEENEPEIAPFPVVGIGASAGGLEAFSQLFTSMPHDTGMAFVLIQHLDPAHKSLLSELLSKTTRMEVTEVVDGVLIEPNHVYVIPANAALRLTRRALHLSRRWPSAGPHFTIDEFFRSLAVEQGRLSIGVVLSGTGSDGSQGIKAIKSACGITFAQDERTAHFPGMPRSAIATGVVDFVLPPARIGEELARVSHHHYVVPPPNHGEQEILPDGEGELREVFSVLMKATGVDFSHYKKNTIRRRIGRRMIVHRLEMLREYLDFLRLHPEETSELYRDVLINVTSFFRDPEVFAALATRISALIQKKEIENSFRAWVPGCSTGEELYSLAICVQEVFQSAGIHPNVQLFGTDISAGAIEIARAGVYPERILQEVSGERLSRYFGRVDGKFQVSKAIRETCIFARQNVTRDAPFSHLDLISCRNVLIYFESILQTGILPLFHYALNPSGLLLLGTAEGVGSAPDLFSTVDHKYKIFARKPGLQRLHEPFTIYRDSRARVTEGQVATGAGGLDLQRRADRVIQERYAPPSVVINEDFQIVQFIGQTGFYLEPASGAASYGLLQMAQGALKYALREVVSRAIKENALVERKGIRVEQRGEVREISLEVVPLGKTADKQRCFLVVFRSLGPQEESNVARTPISPSTESVDEQVIRLRGELADSLAYQRVMAEGQDASLEDLRAANEELGSANEELQSSNEEVGTAREELQSANEELTTLNEELNTRNQQLGLLTDDLRNLFAAVSAPILKVDRDLCLRRITGAAASLGITPADLDHPVRLVQGRLGTLADVETLIHGVLKELTVHTYAMQDSESRWWSLSIRPYRTDDDRIDGAVLTFTDTDAIQRALRNSEQARRYADTIVRTVREPLVVLTRDLRVERANASFYRMFRVKADQTEQRSVYEMGDKQWDNPNLHALLEEMLPKKSVVTDYEVTHTCPGRGSRVMLLNAQRVSNDGEQADAILLAFEDVTDRRTAEQAMKNRLTTTDRELDRTKEELRALAANLMIAHEEERRRISRELHDDLAQRLAVIEMEIEQFRLEQKERSPAEVAGMLNLVQQRVADLSQEIRSISHRMHPAVLDDLGLVTALRSLVEEVGGLRSAPVHFQCKAQPASLSREHAGAVYRIAQEALRNAVTHAPEAAVTVTLTCTSKQLHLKVKDTGPGFDPAAIRASGNLGIVSMQERAHLLGGNLKVQSRPGDGATLTLRIPLPPLAQEKTMTAVR